MKNKKITVLFAALFALVLPFLFSSCRGISDGSSEPREKKPEFVDVKITLNQADLEKLSDSIAGGRARSASRNINPAFNVSELKNLKLSGKFGSAAVNTEIVIHQWDDYDAFEADSSVSIMTGTWVEITLSAEIGEDPNADAPIQGYVVKGTINSVVVSKGILGGSDTIKVNLITVDSLNFELDYASGVSPVNKGGFSLELTYTGEATKVLAYIENREDGTVLQASEILTPDTVDSSNKIYKVTYAKNTDISVLATAPALPEGYYRLVINFYGGTGTGTGTSTVGFTLLTSYRELVYIKGGYVSTATRNITLGELYSITPEGSGYTLTGSIPLNYSSRSETITLPCAKMDGAIFAGWYENASRTGTAITSIPKGSSGNKTLYPLFMMPILFVDQNGTTTGTNLSDGFSTDSTLKTLQQAITQINTVATDSNLASLNDGTDLTKLDWNISITGTISKATEITELNANTLCIYGDSTNYFAGDPNPDTLTIASSESCKSVLKICAPASGASAPDITLQYLKITGGTGQYGGGIDIEGGSLTATYVTFTGNNGIINNDSENCYGGAVYVNTSSESGVVILENCEITGNTSGSSLYAQGHGGAVYLKSAKRFVLSDGGDTSAPGITITGNKSSTGGGIEADETYTGSIELGGKINISGNTTFGSYEFDIWLPYGKKLKINGPLTVPADYTKTGIYMNFKEVGHTPPTLSTPIPFTEGYGYGASGVTHTQTPVNTVAPHNIFFSRFYNYDDPYPVSFTANDGTGEACFAISGGSIHDAFAYRVLLESSLSAVKPLEASTVTITPNITYKVPTNVTPEAGESEPDPIPLYYNPTDGKLYKTCTVGAGGTATYSEEDRALNLTVSVYNGTAKVATLSLSDTSETGAKNTFSVPALYEDSYTIYVKAELDGITYDAEYPLTVSRSLATPLTIEAAGSAVTVTFKNNASGPVTYRINNGDFQTIAKSTTGSISLASAGDKVEFYGDNETYTYGDGDDAKSQINCDAPCYVYGNIMSLISSTDYLSKKELTQNETFARLFYQNENIMNKGGEKLLLPAIELSAQCYEYMFYGCNKLSEAPALPALTLKEQCYSNMFTSCESLKTAPELPATTLAVSCYMSMFGNCTSLTKAPELPAMNLAEQCYTFMFEHCTKLETAPVLPAKTLVNNCYNSMFIACGLLNNVTCYAENVHGDDYTRQWLASVSSIGTFTKAPGATGWEAYSVSGIPNGWTVKEAQGELQCPGDTFTGTTAISGSAVFISGRNLEIPSLIASNHEVTQKEYSEYMAWYGDENGTVHTPNCDSNYGKGDDYPAYYVSWYEAVMYCNLRSLAEGLTPAYYLVDSSGYELAYGRKISTWARASNFEGFIVQNDSGKYYFNNIESDRANYSALNYEGSEDTDGGICFDTSANGWRLPTAAEWEYLARGGNLTNVGQTTYSGSDDLDEVAWHGGGGSGGDLTSNSDGKSHEVMQKISNTFNLYDMSGNVWEWCWDWYGTPTTSTPITGLVKDSGYDPDNAPRRIFMGGCFTTNKSDHLIPTIKGFNWTPLYRANDIGFRVVRNAE